MGELTLIPFGLKVPEQIFLDVSEVDRGRNCNCMCPSCKSALIARQGDKNEWHFAHNSKDTSTSTVKECKYSFWVSVVLMAKQILKGAKTIALPSLTMFANNSTKYEIAKRTIVDCNDLKIDTSFNSTSVDATFTLGQYTIAVYFAAPHREKYYSSEKKNDDIGILEISLNDARQWLYGNNNRGNYRKILEKKIINDVKCKQWTNHPRQAFVENKYNVNLSKEKQYNVNLNRPEISTTAKYYNKPLIKHVAHEGNNFTSSTYGECIICGKNLNKNGGCPACQKIF